VSKQSPIDNLIRKLIIRIWKNGCQNHKPVGQVRATKLMYLIEWEYYAWKRERLTNLDWVYLHYGPWSSKLSETLKDFEAPTEEEEHGHFRQVSWTPPEFDRVDTRLQFELEGIVERVLEIFGPKSTEDIIRYVYFNTEPMQDAERWKPLDFTKTRKPSKPLNPVKTLDKNLRQQLRERLQLATERKLAEKAETAGDITLEELEVLVKLDSSGDFILYEGEIQISNEDRLSIAEEG
jgi:hypothetical protein